MANFKEKPIIDINFINDKHAIDQNYYLEKNKQKISTFYNNKPKEVRKTYMRHGDEGIGPVINTAISNKKISKRLMFNANYINLNGILPNSKNYDYIAAGCPPSSAVMNRLIKRTGIKHVVMVTGIVEQGISKCINYFDNNDVENKVKHSGAVEVKNSVIRLNKQAIYEIRDVKIKTNSRSKKYEYRHYWFRAWPDHGVPETPDAFLDFLNIVRQNAGNEPLLVHCSAGVGRTGTFIILDYIINKIGLDAINTIGEVDKLIKKLRNQRNNFIVQSPPQYMFILQVLQKLKLEKNQTATIATPHLRSQTRRETPQQASIPVLEKPELFGSLPSYTASNPVKSTASTSNQQKRTITFGNNNIFGTFGSTPSNHPGAAVLSTPMEPEILQINRATAEDLLQSQLNGTYLIRNGRGGTHYATLSMKFNDNFIHFIIINENNEYNILGATFTFNTINELEQYYKQYSLKDDIEIMLGERLTTSQAGGKKHTKSRRHNKKNKTRKNSKPKTRKYPSAKKTKKSTTRRK
jgi:protein tyrosine phosphatase